MIACYFWNNFEKTEFTDLDSHSQILASLLFAITGGVIDSVTKCCQDLK